MDWNFDWEPSGIYPNPRPGQIPWWLECASGIDARAPYSYLVYHRQDRSEIGDRARSVTSRHAVAAMCAHRREDVT